MNGRSLKMARYSNLSREELEQRCYWAEKKIEELEAKNKELYEEREHYRFRVQTELEPMIKSRKRAYDNYVTDPERHGGKL